MSPCGTSWTSLETIQSVLNDRLKKDEDTKFDRNLNLENYESSNSNCNICKVQCKRRTRKKSLDSEKTKYSRVKSVVPATDTDRGSSKSLPNQLHFEPNVKELFSFIESVLSSWFVEDGAYTSSQGDSENDDRSKSIEQESDEGDKQKTDDDDVFQITIEKHKKEKRKLKKVDESEFKEISLKFDCW
ncbi:hypothetical protein RUM43_011312 [Polyplax serrata]|uniref:Uncharacterized protein n=1 Tax=Polyplax serrata TaxID=468196 RepID=A0AAN8NLU8_POLSC